MKILIILLIFLSLAKTKWIETTKRHILSPKFYQYYSFDPESTIIKFRIKCTNLCDIYLLNERQLINYINHYDFKYYWKQSSTKDTGLQIYKDNDNIKKKLNILIINNADENITSNIYFAYVKKLINIVFRFSEEKSY
jgi:hypothetical protein